MDIGEWGPAEWGAFGQVGALVVAIVAGILVWLQVRQAREVREDQNRPYVIIDLEFRGTIVMLTVSNIGTTPATNISIQFDRPLQSPTRGVNPSALATFSEPIPMLAPGRKISLLLGRGPDFFSENRPTVPLRYIATVRYQAPGTTHRLLRKPRRYDDPPLVLDLQPFKFSAVDRDDFKELSQQLKDIKVLMRSWTSRQRLRINTISQAEIDEADEVWLEQENPTAPEVDGEGATS